jgi:CBS domain containing-hemolysin-like protein
MRWVLCILLVGLPLSFVFAAKGTMSLSEAQEAAAKGDADAAAAVAMTTDRQTCLSGCANRGHNKEQCTNTCRPGLCHPGAEQPYCVAK